MPKVLFYAGVILCAFAAVLAAAESVRLVGVAFGLSSGTALPSILDASLASTRSALFLVLAAIPIAAIFLRMASLVAARDLFGAFFAAFAVCGGAVSGVIAAASEMRVSMFLRRGISGLAKQTSVPDAMVSISELRVAATWAVGLFLSLALIALRPYFKLHGRVLAALVVFPLPLFIWWMRDDIAATVLVSPAAPATLLTFAATLLLIALHCMRHRHQFVEPTNLREILDASVDPLRGGRPARVGFGGDVAFDQH